MIRHIHKRSKEKAESGCLTACTVGVTGSMVKTAGEVPLKTPDKQRLNKIILDEHREREGLFAPKAEFSGFEFSAFYSTPASLKE